MKIILSSDQMAKEVIKAVEENQVTKLQVNGADEILTINGLELTVTDGEFANVLTYDRVYEMLQDLLEAYFYLEILD